MSCRSMNSLMFKEAVIHGKDSPKCVALKRLWSGMSFLMLLEVEDFPCSLYSRLLSSVHLAMIEKTGFWPG